MPDAPPNRQGLPRAVLVIVYVVVLIVTLVIGFGVLMANVMSCDSGADGCADRALLATGVWGAVTFILPLVALVWGLVSSSETPGGRRSRVIALILIILLPVIGLAANLLILFGPGSG